MGLLCDRRAESEVKADEMMCRQTLIQHIKAELTLSELVCLFSKESQFNDDSVMTLAVARAFMDTGLGASEEKLTKSLFKVLPEIGRNYPDCGWGRVFGMWIMFDEPVPYNSFGNGSAMRVSSVAWLFNDLDSVRRAARIRTKYDKITIKIGFMEESFLRKYKIHKQTISPVFLTK